MTLLQKFIKEYDSLYHDLFLEDSSTAGEIRRVEKIINNPKFHPTLELKNIFKVLKEQGKECLKISIIGENPSDKLLFISCLTNQALLPISPLFANKKIVIKHDTASNVYAVFKDKKVHINPYKVSKAQLNGVEYIEVFLEHEFLKDYELIKTSDSIDKDTKDSDLLLWLQGMESALKENLELSKLVKKKPSLCILTTKKLDDEKELLEKVAQKKASINKNFKGLQVLEVCLLELFKELKLDKRLEVTKSFAEFCTTYQGCKGDECNKLEEISKALDEAKNNLLQILESNKDSNKDLLKEESKKELSQNFQTNKLTDIKESLAKLSQNAKLNKEEKILKALYDKMKLISDSYKLLQNHYQKLYILHKKESDTLILDNINLSSQFSITLYSDISIAIESYLKSIAKAVVDNLSKTTIRLKNYNAGLFARFNTKLFETYIINKQDILNELADERSIVVRNFKLVLSKIDSASLESHDSVQKSLMPLQDGLDEWIKQGHLLILQKRPSFISMDSFFSLQEFNLSVYKNLTQNYERILDDLNTASYQRLLEVKSWLKATQVLMVQNTIYTIEERLKALKTQVREGKKVDMLNIDIEYIYNILKTLIPADLKEILDKIPSKNMHSHMLETMLKDEQESNKTKIHKQILEVNSLRKGTKEALKILSCSIKVDSKLESKLAQS
ncbi:hypothetical protein BKH43_03800 [Helicobacter sp. 13S00401-1]|uniref:hypothetical protein n=1 Tax=Helicobacter sp. 13S00401-1 TaxID=1905758 RepID=UPI000BA5F5FE|nr:hypothetical protein [Helicobacter sp. 13S00401-1]PAF50989.1 hypothetical protein BKH43_03800 [Helicobacter sp. 13S00401-1]